MGIDTKDIGYWMRNLAMTFRGPVAKLAHLGGKPTPDQQLCLAADFNIVC